jgi:hypothetical protein
MITQNDIQSLVEAANCVGVGVPIGDLQLLRWNAGVGHIPAPLPAGFSAVYIFKYDIGNSYLKVGQAGPNSGPRYLSHHYHTTAPSTLAKSIINDPAFFGLLNNFTPRDWLINNTSRYNILIPNIYGKHFVNFVEAFFILKCNPIFER